MLKIEVWKRKLARIGFEGSVVAWPEPQGDDLSVEAVPEDRQLKPVQVIFKVGGDDNRAARKFLAEFRACLRSVYGQCEKQVQSYGQT